MAFIVNSHDNFFDFAGSGEQFPKGILGGKKGEVSNVDGGGIFQCFLVVFAGLVVLSVEVFLLRFQNLIQVGHFKQLL